MIKRQGGGEIKDRVWKGVKLAKRPIETLIILNKCFIYIYICINLR